MTAVEETQDLDADPAPAPTIPRLVAEPDDEPARKLFRYVTFDEWRDHRAIMAVFAGTFFSEFTPDEVTTRLHADGVSLAPEVVADRLESLRRWGNLTVSSAVGNPTSIADYYRRRNRYLITPAGQEVHELVEGVLGRVDEVRDVSTGRLRALYKALCVLRDTEVRQVDATRLADLVQAVFDPHEAFTSEITRFFAAINQWQSRYDLDEDEFRFFAEVLVGYVAERLDEIERTARPIGGVVEAIAPDIATIVERANRGLAARVEDAGLGAAVAVRRPPGSNADDWEHLLTWFVARAGQPSRIERLGREAVAAIRTLTANLTRLSRVGIGASSRRADFLRLARFFDTADPKDLPRLAVAAFGLHPTCHWGAVAEDSHDPVNPSTPWLVAPPALVPLAIRERGETKNRGRTSPIKDRTLERRSVQRQRDHERAAQRRVDSELLAAVEVDGRGVSVAALARLEQLVARTLQRLGVHGTRASHVDGAVVCTVERTPGHDTAVGSSEGTLTLCGLRITFAAADDEPPPTPSASGGNGVG